MVIVKVSPCVALVGMLTPVIEIDPVAKTRLEKHKIDKIANKIEIVFSLISSPNSL